MRNGFVWRSFGSVVVILTLCAGMLSAEDATKDAKASANGLLKLKAGSCTFTLLDSNGVKPLADVTLSLASVKDGKRIAKTASDRMGRCTLDVPKGRHILGVDDLNVSIVEASDVAKSSECRILVSKDALIVGGQDGDAAAGAGAGGGAGLGGLTTQQLVVGGLTVLTVGGGGYAIYDNNKDDDDDSSGAAGSGTVVVDDDDDDDDDADPASP